MGGAQAIAALAYGTETITPVDKITGPGNIYVALAKREVFGQVDIDMIAGPSEIAILADSTANYREIAADLLSQAEHDAMASSILVTDSETLAESVLKEVYRQLEHLPRKEIARQSIDNYGLIYVTETMNEAVSVINELAPEHLEILTVQPDAVAGTDQTCGRHFPGPLQFRAGGRLFCRP